MKIWNINRNTEVELRKPEIEIRKLESESGEHQ